MILVKAFEDRGEMLPSRCPQRGTDNDDDYLDNWDGDNEDGDYEDDDE